MGRLYQDPFSSSVSTLLRQLEREICNGGHYPSCPAAAGICSLLNTPGFLSPDEPGRVCLLPPPPPQPPGPNTMTVPRHGSTTESASQVRHDGQPRAGPMARANSTWRPRASPPPTPAAPPRMPPKSSSRASQGVGRGRLPCRSCMSCHSRPARRVIRAKRALIGRGDGATGVTMRAWTKAKPHRATL